jgi:predicted HicB family RNase H-like nuclease
MALAAGKPSTKKSLKDLAIESVQKEDDAPKPNMQRFNADIPATLHRALKMQAAKEGIALNVLAARLFEEYLSKVNKVSKE